MIRLRCLQDRDAEGMLEWMHDPMIASCFRFDSMSYTKKDVLDFIHHANDNPLNKHYAMVDEGDEYLGAIGLKNIDLKNKKAEFTISLRRKTHGKGIAKAATDLALKEAFVTHKLEKNYLK